MAAYILKPETVPKMLDIAENMAVCHGFDREEAMRIRLLCEEMVTSIYSGIALNPGELRFDVSGHMFAVTASVCTEIRGMSKEQRQAILKAFKPPKRSGLFGFIQDFMDEMALSDEKINFSGYMGMQYYRYIGAMNNMSLMDDLVRIALVHSPAQTQTEDDKDQNKEINLLKGLADGIRVINKHGTFQMTVMKKIPSEFLESYLLSK